MIAGLAFAKVLSAMLAGQAVVTPCPTNTPAGGLVRVQHSVTGQIFFDKSYTRGTAPCSLLEKFTWKLNPDKENRGPCPFKTNPLPTPLPAMLSAMKADLVAAGFVVEISDGALVDNIAQAKKTAESEVAPIKESGKLDAHLQRMIGSMSQAGAAVVRNTEQQDNAACVEVTKTVKAQFGLK